MPSYKAHVHTWQPINTHRLDLLLHALDKTRPNPNHTQSSTFLSFITLLSSTVHTKKAENMGSRLGRRVVHFANLPIKLLMPSNFNNITEIAIKTIPSASKIEIKRVLESLYGFEVDKVSTLNMEGKKKKRGGLLVAKPDYKKAYITLRSPLSISPDLYPIRILEEEKQRMNKQTKSSVVEDGEGKHHWLVDDKPRVAEKKNERFGVRDRDRRRGGGGGGGGGEMAKFPWSSMRSPVSSARR